MKDVSNKTIAFLLVATIIVSLGGTFVSLSVMNTRFFSSGLGSVTGMAIVPNGTVNLTIESVACIQFSSSNIDFGTGSLVEGETNCTLSTLDQFDNDAGCSDFNEVANGFTVENCGTYNLSVEMRVNKTAEAFLGSPGARVLWNVTLNESGSCYNVTTSPEDFPVYPNTSADCGGTACGSSFESAATSLKIVCPNLLYGEDHDALNIDFNITIPEDSSSGRKHIGLIVQGTALS